MFDTKTVLIIGFDFSNGVKVRDPRLLGTHLSFMATPRLENFDLDTTVAPNIVFSVLYHHQYIYTYAKGLLFADFVSEFQHQQPITYQWLLLTEGSSHTEKV